MSVLAMLAACDRAPQNERSRVVATVALDPAATRDAVGSSVTLPLQGLDASESARGTVVSLASDITFDKGEATITRAAEPTLDRLAAAIRARAPQTVAIEGHSDDSGGPIGNQRLSERRAAAVRDYLARMGHVDPTRLTVRGYGASRPVASDDSAAGRARNRHVEIILAR